MVVGRGGRARAGEGLATGAGAFIEGGRVDGRNNEIIGAADVNGGGGAEGECPELRLSKGGHVNCGEGV